jgi:hypothetical protein
VTDLSRTKSLRDVCDLPSGSVLGPQDHHHQRQLRQIGRSLARDRREPDVHLARLTAWIDPVARFDSGECRPQRLRYLTNSYSSVPASPR